MQTNKDLIKEYYSNEVLLRSIPPMPIIKKDESVKFKRFDYLVVAACALFTITIISNPDLQRSNMPTKHLKPINLEVIKDDCTRAITFASINFKIYKGVKND